MAEDTAPKAPTSKRGDSAKNRTYGGKLTDKALELQLTDAFVSVGTVVMFRNEFDGTTIIEGAPKLATSLVELAKGNSKVRSALERMVTATGFAGVGMALMSIVIPILANHGLIPMGG